MAEPLTWTYNYGFLITRKGRNLLAKLLAGERLEMTRVEVGAGKIPEGLDVNELEELIAPVAEATSTAPTVSGNVASMIVEYRNDMNGGLEWPFLLNEFGIFAHDPIAGEILFYYANLGDFPQPVSRYTNETIDIRRFPISIALTTELEVIITYQSFAFVTHEEYLEIFNRLLDMQELINQLSNSVDLLHDLVSGDMPGSIVFNANFQTLSNIIIIDGVYNQPARRIEASI